MEVQILFKEMIKPSSSTPQNLRNYSLSLLDQLAPPVYIPIILFYSCIGENSGEKSDRLKRSFSETLTKFYPLAGRIKDGFSIDCNDEGASYIEAHVAGDMSMVLQDPDIHQLEKLLPLNPHEISSQVILAAQVNHFNCGRMAISICIWHAIADASAAASFATSWAKVASNYGGGGSDIDGVIYDCTSIFPPQDIQTFSLHSFLTEELLSEVLVKRFVFDSSKIVSLREEVGKGPSLDRPTRVEAVAALIWGAVLALNGEEEDAEINAATITVGLRRRLIPALPQQSIGNIYQVAMANCSKNENELDYNCLAGKLHDSIRTMSDDHVRKIHAGGRYFQFLREKSEQLGKNPNLMKVFGFSSWCRFPFYEADFGWGKPIWVGTAMKLYKVAIFIDTEDGEGIEAWIALPKDDMLKFEQNPHICAYASFKSST